jgi:hypothetical protein
MQQVRHACSAAVVLVLGAVDNCYLGVLPVDHARKRNCARNPWCVYGLGEKDGIWKSCNHLIGALGYDVTLNLRSADPTDPTGQRFLPPAGLKNLGATCYLNVLIQVFRLTCMHITILPELSCSVHTL